MSRRVTSVSLDEYIMIVYQTIISYSFFICFLMFQHQSQIIPKQYEVQTYLIAGISHGPAACIVSH